MNEAREQPGWGQRLFDHIGFLVAIGLLIPFLFYFLWGIWEIFSVPQADYSFILGGE